MSRSVIVTGASTGIGRATALHLDGRGWTVFAGVRRREDGQALADRSSQRLEPVILDVTKERAIERVAAEIDESVGEEGLTGLVNNAGVFIGGPLELLPLEDFRGALEVNLTGQIAVTQAMLPALRRARGRIVFITSIGGRIAAPFGAPYHASKWGLEAVAESLQGELAPFGVQVSTVEPATVTTEIWRKGQEYGNEARERMGEEGERLYGRAVDAMFAVAREADERGIPPERVARVIERALTTSRPRARYLVGREARVMVAVRNLVGPRRWSRLARRQMRLP
jgi:NAD(P)-dependent dehydrogenase (short-subunit alcohol dehydrogenase family)